MSRRLFYVTMGAVVGVLVVRKLTQTAQRLTPAGVSESMTGALGGLSQSIRELGELVREGMAEREAELRVSLGLDGTHDVVDSPASTGGLEPDVREDGLR